MPPLFREAPDLDLVERFLQTSVGLRNLADKGSFTRQMIRVQDVEQLLPELEPYYIPCKAKEFLHYSLTRLRCLTILRQLIRAHGFELCGKEQSIGGKKELWYSLTQNATTHSVCSNDLEIQVVFD